MTEYVTPTPRRGPASVEEWDSQMAGHAESTFFHTEAWAGIVSAAFPQSRPAYARIGPAPGILLPVFEWRRARGLLTTAHSSFPFLYGGPVPARLPDGSSATPLALRHLEGRRCSYRMTGNPFAETADPPGAPAGQLDHTHILALPDDEEAYWDMLTPAKRNDVRRLSKKGVAIEESRSAADIDDVYRHYRASFERWGGAPRFVHPAGFYHALVELGGPNVRFTVARSGATVIGGAFVVRWNGRAHYLAGYFDHEQRRLRANVLLQVDSIRSAVRDGLREYDFLPSGGHTGVEEFKKGLGGVARAFAITERRRGAHRLFDALARMRSGKTPAS